MCRSIREERTLDPLPFKQWPRRAVVQRSKIDQNPSVREQPRGMIVSTALDYRRLAAEAEALARVMSRNDYRDEARQHAAEYRRLAAELEARERSFRPRR
jgi:hypothetical protein